MFILKKQTKVNPDLAPGGAELSVTLVWPQLGSESIAAALPALTAELGRPYDPA